MITAMNLCAPRAGQRIHREDVYMPMTSMFHALAWGFPFIAVTLGLKIVLPGRHVPEDLLKLRESEKVTVSHCVPTIVQMLLAEADASKQDLAGWTMIIGGAALPPALCRTAREKGIDIFAGSGMSETGPVVTLAQIPPGVTPVNADDDVQRRSRTGRPAPFVELRVVDEGMRDVPRDGKTQGEIVLRSPFSTQGYFKNPQASKALWAGGYLHSQDVAVMFPDGSVQIVDRIKDVIKTGGEWVSSIEVESLIGDVPGVQEAAVIAVKDEKWVSDRWRSSSRSPMRRSTRTRCAPTCCLMSRRTASASTRCPRSTASHSSPRSRKRASARSTRSCCASATPDTLTGATRAGGTCSQMTHKGTSREADRPPCRYGRNTNLPRVCCFSSVR
jgi:acyl-CoA synthetase (AMP-forming)/AMP-acid ligase II